MSNSKGQSSKIKTEICTVAVKKRLAPFQRQCLQGEATGHVHKPKPEWEMQPALRAFSKTLAPKEKVQSSFINYILLILL